MLASAVAEFTLQDLLSPELLEDPYPAFSRLRADAPVHRQPGSRNWILSRYEHVAAALADRRLSAQTIISMQDKIRGVHPILASLSRQMLFQDPPDHTRLRGLMVKAFTPQRIEGLRPRILEMTTRLLDEAERDGGCIDFMDAFAIPLPVAVISHMLGMPEEDNRQLQTWSWSFGNLINGCDLTPEETRDAFDGVYTLIRYLSRLIAEKRRRPGNDMISDLIASEQTGDRLDMEELMMNIILLFGAGHGTTTHLLGNAMLSLMRNPLEFELFAGDSSIAVTAVNELLRFESPIRLTTRVAIEDHWIEDQHIRCGDEVTMLIASANHDENHFQDPDRLDLRRTGKRQLYFGYGMHTCIGAALARMETQVALAEIARRFPCTWLEDNEHRRMPTVVFRGLETLPLVLA